jgi:hypothetical protein
MPVQFPDGTSVPTVAEFEGSDAYKALDDSGRMQARNKYLNLVNQLGSKNIPDWTPEKVQAVGQKFSQATQASDVLGGAYKEFGKGVFQRTPLGLLGDVAGGVRSGMVRTDEGVASSDLLQSSRGLPEAREKLIASGMSDKQADEVMIGYLADSVAGKFAETAQQRQEFEKGFDRAPVTDPLRFAAQSVPESLVPMFQPSKIGTPVVNPIGTVAGGGLQEVLGTLREELGKVIDITNPEEVAQVIGTRQGREYLADAEMKGIIRGGTIGILEGIAQKFGAKGILKADKAAGKAAQAVKGKVLGKAATGADLPVRNLEEAAREQLFRRGVAEVGADLGGAGFAEYGAQKAAGQETNVEEIVGEMLGSGGSQIGSSLYQVAVDDWQQKAIRKEGQVKEAQDNVRRAEEAAKAYAKEMQETPVEALYADGEKMAEAARDGNAEVAESLLAQAREEKAAWSAAYEAPKVKRPEAPRAPEFYEQGEPGTTPADPPATPEMEQDLRRELTEAGVGMYEGGTDPDSEQGQEMLRFHAYNYLQNKYGDPIDIGPLPPKKPAEPTEQDGAQEQQARAQAAFDRARMVDSALQGLRSDRSATELPTGEPQRAITDAPTDRPTSEYAGAYAAPQTPQQDAPRTGMISPARQREQFVADQEQAKIRAEQEAAQKRQQGLEELQQTQLPNEEQIQQEQQAYVASLEAERKKRQAMATRKRERAAKQAAEKDLKNRLVQEDWWKAVPEADREMVLQQITGNLPVVPVQEQPHMREASEQARYKEMREEDRQRGEEAPVDDGPQPRKEPKPDVYEEMQRISDEEDARRKAMAETPLAKIKLGKRQKAALERVGRKSREIKDDGSLLKHGSVFHKLSDLKAARRLVELGLADEGVGGGYFLTEKGAEYLGVPYRPDTKPAPPSLTRAASSLVKKAKALDERYRKASDALEEYGLSTPRQRQLEDRIALAEKQKQELYDGTPLEVIEEAYNALADDFMFTDEFDDIKAGRVGKQEAQPDLFAEPETPKATISGTGGKTIITTPSGEQVRVYRAHPTGRRLGFYRQVAGAKDFDSSFTEYLGRTRKDAVEYLSQPTQRKAEQAPATAPVTPPAQEQPSAPRMTRAQVKEKMRSAIPAEYKKRGQYSYEVTIGDKPITDAMPWSEALNTVKPGDEVAIHISEKEWLGDGREFTWQLVDTVDTIVEPAAEVPLDRKPKRRKNFPDGPPKRKGERGGVRPGKKAPKKADPDRPDVTLPPRFNDVDRLAGQKPTFAEKASNVAREGREGIGGLTRIIAKTYMPVKNRLRMISSEIFTNMMRSSYDAQRGMQGDLDTVSDYLEATNGITDDGHRLAYKSAQLSGESEVIRNMAESYGFLDAYKTARITIDNLLELAHEAGLPIHDFTEIEVTPELRKAAKAEGLTLPPKADGEIIDGTDLETYSTERLAIKRLAAETGAYRREYWPRSLYDYNAMREKLGLPEDTPIEKAIREENLKRANQTLNETNPDRAIEVHELMRLGKYGEAQKKLEAALGRVPDMTPAEEDRFVGQWISGMTEEAGLDNSSNNFFGRRAYRDVDPDQAQFYEDPDASMINLIRRVHEVSAKRTVLGLNKSPNATVESRIDNVVADMVREGDLNTDQQLQVKDMLTAYFNNKGVAPIGKVWKDLENMQNIANGVSAAVQLADTFVALLKYGAIDMQTTKAVWDAVRGKGALSLKDVGADINSLQDILNTSPQTEGKRAAKSLARKTDKLSNLFFHLSGFRKLDHIGKQALLNLALKKAQRRAKRGNLTPEMRSLVDDAFPDADVRAGVMEVLKHGEFEKTGTRKSDPAYDDDVRYLMFLELSEMQPISPLNMPERYLRAGTWGKLAYQFMSFTINRWGLYHQTATDKNLTKKERTVAGTKLLLMAIAAEGAAMAVQDLMLQREEELDERLLSYAMRAMGFNRYITGQIERGNYLEAFGALAPLVPKFRTLETIGEGGDKGAVPVVGRFLDRYTGDGKERNEKRLKDIVYAPDHNWLGERIGYGGDYEEKGARALTAFSKVLLGGFKAKDIERSRFGAGLKPSRYYTRNGVKTPMTPEEFQTFVKRSGDLTRQKLRAKGEAEVWDKETTHKTYLEAQAEVRNSMFPPSRGRTRSRRPRRRRTR